MKLSIIIPAFNVEKFIRDTLNSLIKQTVKEFEVIVVDDGSLDNTYSESKKILLNSGLKSYKVIQKENGGVSSARNKGLEQSTGEYVLFLDGDDYLSYEAVESILKHIDQGPEVVCWGYDTVNENKTVINSYFDLVDFKMKDLSGIECLRSVIINKTLFLWTGSVLYNKKFLIENEIKYTNGCSNGEDQEFIYKALSRANKVLFINKVLSYYLQREGSISNSYNLKRFDAINAMKRTYKFIEQSSDPKMIEVGEYLRGHKIIGNYFYNLESCYMKASNRNIKELFLKIDEINPGLNYEVKMIMQKFKSRNIKYLLKVKLFLISPSLYLNYVYLKYKLKNVQNL